MVYHYERHHLTSDMLQVSFEFVFITLEAWDQETIFSQLIKQSTSQQFLEWAGKFF